MKKLFVYSLLLIFCLSSSAALTNDDYVLATINDFNYSVISTIDHIPALNCPGTNNCYHTNFYVDYKIPVYHLRNEDVLFQVKHGNVDDIVYNISINQSNYYNSTHIKVGIESEWYSTTSGTYYTASRPKIDDGTGFVFFGEYHEDAVTAISELTVSENVFSDGDYSTGGYMRSPTVFNYHDTFYSNIYEKDLFWVTKDLQDVVFTVNNVFGRPVEGVTVVITRNLDNVSYGSKTTDLSGQVLIEDLNRDTWFTLSVLADGFQNFTGQVNIIDNSYTVTLSDEGSSGDTFYNMLFNNIGFIRTPTNNPLAEINNFSLFINSSDSQLEYYGVSSSFNGTDYNVNGSLIGGGSVNLTLDLTNQSGKTILVNYFFKKINTSIYSQNIYFIIGVPGSSNTSITGLDAAYGEVFSPLTKSFLIMFAIILVVVLFSAVGVSGSVIALITLPIHIAALIFGWLDPVITGMSVLIIVGIVIIKEKGGL